MSQTKEERGRKARISARLRTKRYEKLEAEMFWKPTITVKDPRGNRFCVECKTQTGKGKLIRLDAKNNHVWHYASSWSSCWQTWVAKQMRKIAEREEDTKNGGSSSG